MNYTYPGDDLTVANRDEFFRRQIAVTILAGFGETSIKPTDESRLRLAAEALARADALISLFRSQP